jgi:hypothetical protein
MLQFCKELAVLLLVAVLAQTLLPLMGSNLMTLPLFSTRHSSQFWLVNEVTSILDPQR